MGICSLVIEEDVGWHIAYFFSIFTLWLSVHLERYLGTALTMDS